jgi:uncharacterized membrane protein (UPF0127 family)
VLAPSASGRLDSRLVPDSWHRLIGEDGTVLLDRVCFARRLTTRVRGLIGRTSLERGEGLAFREKSIHMLFMRMSLDIVFVDRDLTVVKLVERLRPWRFAACASSRYVLEIAPGDVERLGLGIGDRLRLEPPL